ncbi:MAG: hypothetical protein J6X18_12580 [Bacteroidales bacterium]|nr:hypothetical protein [Bacteroidales bacterium]
MKKIFLFLTLLATVSMASCCGNANNQDAVEAEAPVEEMVIDVDEPETDTIIDLGEQIDAEVEEAPEGDSI